MASFTRAAADMRLTEARDMLARVGYDHPARVAKALARLERHDAMRPTPATAATLRAAYLSGADASDIDAHANRAAAAAIQRSAWSEARTDLAILALDAIRDHAPQIIEHVRDEAERVIGDLHWWAHAGAPSPATLLGANKVEDAKRAASIEAGWLELMALRKLRAAVTPRDFPWVRLAFKSGKVEKVRPGDLDSTVTALRNGARLWWPKWGEALKAQAALDKADEAKVKAERQARSLERRMAI